MGSRALAGDERGFVEPGGYSGAERAVLRERRAEYLPCLAGLRLFGGSITAKELDWSEGQIRDFVATRESANPHLCLAVGIQGTEMKLGIGEAKC